jgi:hypothetical protein
MAKKPETSTEHHPYGARSRMLHNHPRVVPTTIIEGRQADANHAMHGIDPDKVHHHDGRKFSARTFDGGGLKRMHPDEAAVAPTAGRAPGPARPSRGIPTRGSKP